MTNEAIEEMVEEIMRDLSNGNYELYNSEELREHYRQLLKENENARSENV